MNVNLRSIQMINYELIDRKYIINRISAIDFEERGNRR